MNLVKLYKGYILIKNIGGNIYLNKKEEEKMKYIKFCKKASVLIIALVTFFSFTMATIGEEEIEDTSSKAVTWEAQIDFTESYLGKNSYVIFGEAPDATDGPPHDSYDTPVSPAPPVPCIKANFDDGLTIPYNKLLKDYRL